MSGVKSEYRPVHHRGNSVDGQRLEQSEQRVEQAVEVRAERPVINVIEIMQDTLFDLLFGVGFAAPTVYLGPASDAGLHPVTGKIAVDDLLIESFLRLRLGGVRARSNQRKLTR